MVIKFLVFDLIKCYPQPILQPEYVDEVSSSTLVKGPWPHKPCPRDLGHLPRGHKQLLPTPQPPNKCTSSPAAVPRCTYCQPSYCLRTACAALTHTCLSFPLSSPVLCAKHWLFQGRRGHQAANKYTLTTGRNNYCPVLPPLRVRGTVPILAHSLLVLTVVIRSA